MLNLPTDGSQVGEIVATARDYESAQKVVSKLIAAEVPARDIAIVGQGVRTIERVTGKLGYAAAARSGAINGVLIGLLLSAFLVLGNPEVPIQLFVGFVLIGVALGMLMSLITYAIVRRRRDFASVTQLAADHYEVTVLPSSLAKARQVLGPQRPAPVRPPADLDEPPRYGERITPGQTGPAGQGTAAPSAEMPLGVTGPAAPGSVPEAASPAGVTVPAQIPPRPADPVPRYGERIPDAGHAEPRPESAPAPGAARHDAVPDEAAPEEQAAPGASSGTGLPDDASQPGETPRPNGGETRDA